MTLGALVVALALGLAACAPQPFLAPPLEPVPDLRGTWRGTWAGAPVTLVVIEQGGVTTQGGVSIGAWPVSGTPLETVGGVFTFPSNGAPITVNVRGRLGHLDGNLALVVDALTRDVRQLVLAPVAEDRLVGGGKSNLGWEPFGPVELTRVVRP